MFVCLTGSYSSFRVPEAHVNNIACIYQLLIEHRLSLKNTDSIPLPGTPTLGAGRAATPSALIHGRAGRAKIDLYPELVPSLLFAEEAFFGIVDSLVHELFLGASPQTPKLSLYYYEINVLSIVRLEKSLKTKI